MKPGRVGEHPHDVERHADGRRHPLTPVQTASDRPRAEEELMQTE